MSSGSWSSSSITSSSNWSAVSSSMGGMIVECFDERVLHEPEPVVDLAHQRVDAAPGVVVFAFDPQAAGDGQADVGEGSEPAERLRVVEGDASGGAGTRQGADDGFSVADFPFSEAALGETAELR